MDSKLRRMVAVYHLPDGGGFMRFVFEDGKVTATLVSNRTDPYAEDLAVIERVTPAGFFAETHEFMRVWERDRV